MMPAYPLILSANTLDGAALANSVAATSILPASAICAIPGGTLQVGSHLKITLRGRISTVVTTPGTLTLDLRLGGIVVSAFGVINLNIVAQANASWEVSLIATVRSIGSGAAATALCTGDFISRAVVGSPAVTAGSAGEVILPDVAPAVGAGFDSTLALSVNVFATWSVASVSNSIQVHQALVELKV